jgi:glucose/arabinose dehydrogenase
MLLRSAACTLICNLLCLTSLAELPAPLVTGLALPESVAVTREGRVFVSSIGERDKDKDGDGQVLEIKNGKAVEFAKGLNDPKGLIAHQKNLFVTDKNHVLKIDEKGVVTELVGASAFPKPPQFLNDIVADETGNLYVTDSGDRKGDGGAIYKITQKEKQVTLVLDKSKFPALHSPNGIAMDGMSFVLLGDMGTETLYRVKVADGSVEKLAEGLGKIDGVIWDNFGRLFLTAHSQGKVHVIPRPGMKAEVLAEGFGGAADLCLDATGTKVLVPDMKNGTVTAIEIKVPGAPVNEKGLTVTSKPAFPNLKWTGWDPEENGKPTPLRPIVLTHANDGSNRVFVATQHGVIHYFDNDENKTQETKIFADLRDRVVYNDKQNEEGFLGLAIHPKFKENGEVYVFYTTNTTKLTNIVSRFRVKKDNPNQLDPASEEQLLVISKPFWNHDGGTIAFGPDGYLYICHGDGGSGGDPQENGQKLATWLGKILRIDVNNRDGKKGYAIPKDNPFVGTKDALPEIYAFGFRNIWRMHFDRQGGQLWAADVGQNLWEEINLVERGGNFGWSQREGQHPFGAKGVGLRKDMIEPIWEYYHDIGKSITGGTVYRGSSVPELKGMYVYADYVTGKQWALKYDEKEKRVTANRALQDLNKPILSFGEDEKGEVYYLTTTLDGKGIYKFLSTGQ